MFDKSRFLLYCPVNDKEPHFIKDYHPAYFDLHMNYYGDNDNNFCFEGFDHTKSFIKKHKWPAISDLLEDQESILHKGYSYIMFMDNDMIISSSDLLDFFNIVNDFKFPISQPSVTRLSSYWSFLEHREDSFYRLVRFCEVMMPCFKYDVLLSCKDLLSKSESGWGLDCVWGYQYDNYVVDVVVAEHIGGVTSHNWKLSNNKTPQKEKEDLIKEYKIPKI